MTDSTPINDETRVAEFVQLLTAHQPDVYLYLRSLVLNPDEASEVLQEVNLVLWEKRNEFQLGTNFRAWAFQIARYKLLQHQGRRQRACRYFSDELIEELVSETSENENQFAEMIDYLRHCVSLLSSRDRELIGERYAPRATCRSVAESVGRPVRWVYKAVSRIRKTLFECVTREMSDGRNK